MQRSRRLQFKGLPERILDYLWANGLILLLLLTSIEAFICIRQSYALFRGNDEVRFALEILKYREQAWPFWTQKFGYPLAVACISSVLTRGNVFMAANIVAVSSSVLFLWATYVIFENLFDRKIALLTTLATLTSFAFFFHGMASATDMPFACLSMLSVCFLIRKRAPRVKEVILAGILGGLATVTRDNGVVLLFFILLLLLFNPYRLNLKRRAVLAVAYLMPYLAIQARWAWIALVSLTQKNVALADYFAVPPGNPMPHAIARSTSMARGASRNPFVFVDRFATQFFLRLKALNSLLWQPIPLTTSLFLVVLGMLLWLREPKRRTQVVFFLYLVLHIGATAVQEANRHPRLLLPVLPALCFFALLSFTSNALIPNFKVKLPLLKSRASLKLILLAPLLTWGTYSAAATAKGEYHKSSQNRTYKPDVVRWLQEQPPSPDKKVIVMSTSSLEFLLGDHGIDYRGVSAFDDVWEYPEGTSYLIFEKPEQYHGQGSPHFLSLEFPLEVSANLEPVWLAYPESRRDVAWAAIYQVLEAAHNVEAAGGVRASSCLGRAAQSVTDHHLGTHWTSQKHSIPFHTEWIALDLGEQNAVNRAWLLPNEGGMGFPRDFKIQVSGDGEEWMTVVEEHDYPRPEGAQPQVFPFDEVTCRFLRILADELGEYAPGGNEYALSFREVVVKLAYEEAPPPAVSISPSSISYAPETGTILTRMRNEGSTTITATVRFYNEYPLERAMAKGYLAALPLVIPPGESVSVPVGVMWPSGSYPVTVKVTEEGNVRSRQASKEIEITSPSTASDARAISLPQQAVYYRFGDKFALVGYTAEADIQRPEIQRNEYTPFTLYWRALTPIRENYRVYVYLVDQAGSIQSQKDFPLTSTGGHSTRQLEQWEMIRSRSYLQINVPSGTYQLKVSLYSTDAVEPLRVFDADSMIWSGDAATLTELTIR